MKKILFLLICLPSLVFSQVTDNFSDGNFTLNPTWTGNDVSFLVTAGELQSNGPNQVNSKIYLSTHNTLISNTEWSFLVDLKFNPTATNFVRIYLVSNQPDLSAVLNGYYIEIGQTTADFIHFGKQTAAVNTTLFTGSSSLGTGNIKTRIKVTRDSIGTWQVYSDPVGGTNYISEGNTFIDSTYKTSVAFGVYCEYATASRYNLYYFDDFSVGNIHLDVTPPHIANIAITSDSTIDLAFNEPVNQITAETEANYSINHGVGNPTSATLDGAQPSLVHLLFSSHFAQAQPYAITVTNVKDLLGNAISTDDTLFYLPKAFDVVINEIFADPDTMIGLPNYEWVEIANTTPYPISLKNWRCTVGSSVKLFPEVTLLPDSFLILTSLAGVNRLSAYGAVVGFSTFSITNTGTTITLCDAKNRIYSSVTFSDFWYRDETKKAGGWSLEQIDPLNPCGGAANWSASNSPNGGTPGKTNSIDGANPDVVKPRLSGVTVIGNRTLKLNFSEPLDSTSLKRINKYSVNYNVGFPISVTLIKPDFSTVYLTFADTFDLTTIYTITVNDTVEDCSGNYAVLQSKIFSRYTAKSHDIVINEIMTDPDPVVGLPNIEYVELYNRTNYPISLRKWTFSISTTIKPFPDMVIDPKGYLILTSDAAMATMSNYGLVANFSTFSLANDADLLVLTDSNNKVIHTIDYSIDWLHNINKINGGWSCEQIDPTNPCGESNNWKASVDARGGTPGIINSVKTANADITKPVLKSAVVIGSRTLKLTFSETLDSTSLKGIGKYTVDNYIGHPAVVKLIKPDYSSVLLTFADTFNYTTIYTITVNDTLEDCVGNYTVLQTKKFSRYTAKPYDIVINEIMADPDPVVGLPNFEYIELYNKTDYPISLRKWTLSVATSESPFPDIVIDPKGYLILTGNTAAASMSSYGALATFASFSLANSEDLITLADSNNNVIHTINFSSDWYKDKNKVDGGWSCELIDPLNPCGKTNNWRASINSKGGTPGTVNSVYSSNPDASKPKLKSAVVTGNTSLKLIFSESLDNASIKNIGKYTVDNNIGHPISVKPIRPDYSAVILIFTDTFNYTSVYTIIVNDTIEDCSGNITVSQTTKFSRYSAKPFDIVINEIMADPDPAVGLPNVEYIELYNRTDFPISLRNWSLSISLSSKPFPDIAIEAKGYLILTTDAAAETMSTYGLVANIPGFTLANDANLLVLSDSAKNIIHTINFSSDWYQDKNKVDGGWSCEQMDPLNPCGESNNWKASVDVRGGTPGTVNSIFNSNPDNIVPELTRISFINNKQIRIYFSEQVKPATCKSRTMYKIDNEIGYPANVFPIAPEYKTVELSFADSFKHNVIYHVIIIDTLSDCVGNKIVVADTGRFAVPEEVDPSQVLINEVLYNAKGDGVEFVEIYNNADEVYDLKDFWLCNYDTILSSVKDKMLISADGFLIFPGDYIVLTSSPEKVKSQYIALYPNNFVKMPAWSTLTDAEDFVVLAKKNFQIVDKFKYTDKMQFSLLNTSDGVSLERINVNRPTDDVTNWHSAAESVGFATPTYKNSQYSEAVVDATEVSLEPEMFSPDNDGVNDVLNIKYRFDTPGYTANIVIYDERGRTVRSFAKNQLLGTSGIFSWDGINDDGEKSRVGIYIVYFEAFNLNGTVKHYKKTCVLASKLK